MGFFLGRLAASSFCSSSSLTGVHVPSEQHAQTRAEGRPPDETAAAAEDYCGTAEDGFLNDPQPEPGRPLHQLVQSVEGLRHSRARSSFKLLGNLHLLRGGHGRELGEQIKGQVAVLVPFPQPRDDGPGPTVDVSRLTACRAPYCLQAVLLFAGSLHFMGCYNNNNKRIREGPSLVVTVSFNLSPMSMLFFLKSSGYTFPIATLNWNAYYLLQRLPAHSGKEGEKPYQPNKYVPTTYLHVSYCHGFGCDNSSRLWHL